MDPQDENKDAGLEILLSSFQNDIVSTSRCHDGLLESVSSCERERVSKVASLCVSLQLHATTALSGIQQSSVQLVRAFRCVANVTSVCVCVCNSGVARRMKTAPGDTLTEGRHPEALK